jgi:hypothetical protein
MLNSKFSFLEEFGILLTNDSAHNVYVGPTEHCQSHHYGHWRDGGCAGYEVPENCAFVLVKEGVVPTVVCENGESFPAKHVK